MGIDRPSRDGNGSRFHVDKLDADARRAAMVEGEKARVDVAPLPPVGERCGMSYSPQYETLDLDSRAWAPGSGYVCDKLRALVLLLYQLKDKKPGAELKGSAFTLTVVHLLSSELEDVERDLREKIATGPRFFANAPVVLDLDRVRDSQPDLDFPALVQLLKELALIPVGVRHATPAQQEEAVAAGFALVKGGGIRELPAAPGAKGVTGAKAEEPRVPEKTETLPSKLPQATESSASGIRAKTVYRPVRSGQQIYAKNRDLVVLAPVNAGAEVVADGDVHIYGTLRGRALAGAQGDRQARIFCQSMAAELIAIAGCYQVLDESVPREVRGRAVQVYLEGDKLRFELLA